MSVETQKQKIGTFVFVTDPEMKNVLLGKRLSNVWNGYYGAPGGTLDAGESLSTGVDREAREEAGVSLGKHHPFIVIVDHQPPPTNDFIHFGFVCSKYKGDITTMEPNKCVGWEWFAMDKLPSPIVPAQLAALNYLLSHKDDANMGLIEIDTK